MGNLKTIEDGTREAETAQLMANLGRSARVALALDDAFEGDPSDVPLASFVALRESRRSGAAILSFVNALSARDFASAPSAHAAGARMAAGPARS